MGVRIHNFYVVVVMGLRKLRKKRFMFLLISNPSDLQVMFVVSKYFQTIIVLSYIFEFSTVFTPTSNFHIPILSCILIILAHVHVIEGGQKFPDPLIHVTLIAGLVRHSGWRTTHHA